MIIEFTKEAWEVINTYIALAEGEISGLAVSKLNETKDKIIVSNVKIWEQECTAGSTEVVDNNKMLELIEEFIAEGILMRDINVWWHSHAAMGCFFSTTDNETINGWINNKFLTAIVGNKKGEFKGKISIKEPIPCSIEDVSVQAEQASINKTLKAKIEKELKEKIIEPLPIVTPVSRSTTPWYDHHKKIKRDRYYLAYQADVAKLTGEEKSQALKYNANECNCDECQAWLERKLKKFPFKTHVYDIVSQLWMTEDEYDEQDFRSYHQEQISLNEYGRKMATI